MFLLIREWHQLSFTKGLNNLTFFVLKHSNVILKLFNENVLCLSGCELGQYQ